VLPVTNINIAYKNPAKLEDVVMVETSLEKFTSLYAIFKQQMFEKETKKLLCEAQVTVVAVDCNGKLYRKMPQKMLEIFNKSCEI
jgi:YbgC/YbaW family acyl-CoA thioester hydrolase